MKLEYAVIAVLAVLGLVVAAGTTYYYTQTTITAMEKGYTNCTLPGTSGVHWCRTDFEGFGRQLGH